MCTHRIKTGLIRTKKKLTEAWRWCGSISFQQSYEYVTCADTLTVSYTTGSSGVVDESNNYRGFRAYFELIDKPEGCKVTTGSTSTTMESTMTTTTALTPPDKPASILRTVDICAGQNKTISCYDISPQHTVFIANAFFGVKKGTFCGYSPGDCTQEEMYNDCNSSETTCKISASSFKFLSNCGFLSRASYYHLDYYCVPCKFQLVIFVYKVSAVPGFRP